MLSNKLYRHINVRIAKTVRGIEQCTQGAQYNGASRNVKPSACKYWNISAAISIYEQCENEENGSNLKCVKQTSSLKCIGSAWLTNHWKQ